MERPFYNVDQDRTNLVPSSQQDAPWVQVPDACAGVEKVGLELHRANGLQIHDTSLLAEGDPYGSYPTAMPYDPRLQVYPSANVLTQGMALYTAPYEMGPPFAQGHAFAATTTPSPYFASNNNLIPENSSNSSTAGTDHASKPRSICSTCGRDFSRASDMQRHAKKHGASKYFQCPVTGCKYAGSYRKDKLDQHVKNMH